MPLCCCALFCIAVALQKSLVTALRELHSKRPPPEQVQEFLVAVLENKTPPEVQPSAKGEDEGVYEYFKTKGVFGLLKVSSMEPALFCRSVRSLQMAAAHCLHVVCRESCAKTDY